MVDTFRDRAELGEQFAIAAFDFLRSGNGGLIRHVVRSGIEHSEFREAIEDLRRDDQAMARRLRFTPDGALHLRGVGFRHLEAKASRNIEREPYEYYLRFEEAGEPVFLLIGPPPTGQYVTRTPVYIGRVRDLVLRHGADTVSQYPSDHQYPITQDGWIAPRHAPRGAARGSGTQYREIDVPASGMLRIASAKWDDRRVYMLPDFLAADTAQRADRHIPHPGAYLRQRDLYLRAIRESVRAGQLGRDELVTERRFLAAAFRELLNMIPPGMTVEMP